jgi:hypothetical protein
VECMRVTDVFMTGHFRKLSNNLPLLLGMDVCQVNSAVEMVIMARK